MKLSMFSMLVIIIGASQTTGPQTPKVVVTSQEGSSTVTTTQTVTSGSASGPAAQTSDLPTKSVTAVNGSPPIIPSSQDQQSAAQALRAVVSLQENSVGAAKTQTATSSTTGGLATRSTDTVPAKNIQVNGNPTTVTRTVQSSQLPIVSVNQDQITTVSSSLNHQSPKEGQPLPTQASVAKTQGTARIGQTLPASQPLASGQISNNSQTRGQTREGPSAALSPSTPKPSDRQRGSTNLPDTPQHDQPPSAQKHQPTNNPPAVANQHLRPTDQSSSQRPATQEAVNQEEKQLPVSSQKVSKAAKPPKSKKTKSHEEKAKKSRSKRKTKSKSDKENVENDEKKKSKSKSSDKKKKSGKFKKSKSKDAEKKSKSVKLKKSAT
ncbi:hypothetical protein NBO_495g0002 [Nosema bombycis CQ1]|uniref:Uncharacterized protein n=1 Tax=Nosema bombycis (strain CQ1 / CVCC 102059) TaxID=578461 RepID=R0MHF2_NOSB1|nr:hypothetical protein NBO_495g0002 [Nosema bombycis CQ1]|eukprot:EOB12228.1 hypothetical protein NBO_495g0002 [Nosema bombycis CQ1]